MPAVIKVTEAEEGCGTLCAWPLEFFPFLCTILRAGSWLSLTTRGTFSCPAREGRRKKSPRASRGPVSDLVGQTAPDGLKRRRDVDGRQLGARSPREPMVTSAHGDLVELRTLLWAFMSSHNHDAASSR